MYVTDWVVSPLGIYANKIKLVCIHAYYSIILMVDHMRATSLKIEWLSSVWCFHKMLCD